MAEFAYNNVINATTSHILFKLNYRYHLKVLFEYETNFCLRFRSANKLAKKLRKLIKICYQNLLNIKEL